MKKLPKEIRITKQEAARLLELDRDSRGRKLPRRTVEHRIMVLVENGKLGEIKEKGRKRRTLVSLSSVDALAKEKGIEWDFVQKI